MKDKTYKLPHDTPAHACGRCFWWRPNKDEGWGRCLVHHEKRWYACMTCSEYEFEP